MIIHLIMNYCVELEFKNRKEVIELYENGQLVAILDDDEQENGRLLKATMMIPFERTGSKEHAFVGYVDDIRLGSQKTFASTMELDYLVTSASIIAEESKNKQLQDILKEAQNVVDNHDASKEKINEAVTNLEKTMNNLKKQKLLLKMMIQQKMIHHLKKTKSQIIASANKDNKKTKEYINC